MSTSKLNILRNFKKIAHGILPFLSIFILAISLSACNNSDDNDNAQDMGEVIIGLTDAQGDFVSYSVDVVSLSLTKANGAVVETVPLTTRVDFAQYTEMTEFLTAATIPTGTYVSATLTLDYANADIQVEDANGYAIPVTAIQDENNNPINSLELSVRLDGRNSLFIAPGIPVHLSLDFDLSASHSVDFTTGDPVVSVKPFLLAEVNAESDKIHRARGPLKSVNVADSSFRLIIRPFVHVISGGDERFGTLKVLTTNTTIFDINGSVSQGSAGLIDLGQQSPLTAVVVIGDLKFNPTRFEATEVRAGSSVAGGVLDVVTGNVTSRSGDVLTVKGATLIRTDGSVIFNDQVEITVGSSTIVRRQLSIDALTTDDISVGQRLTVFGTLTNNQAQNLAMDATAGFVHMLFTTLRASVLTTTPVTIHLQSIGGRRIELFDFSGTGADSNPSDPADDNADPTNYEIEIGNININSIAPGDVVKMRGFVKPFSKIQSPDFAAETIINVSNIPAAMVIGWPFGSPSALNIDQTNNDITLDFINTGIFHHLSRAGVVTDLTQLGMDTTVQANAQNIGLYFVYQNGVWQLHTSFRNYLGDLQSRLDANGAVRSVTATGLYNDNTAVMSVNSMTVHIIDNP